MHSEHWEEKPGVLTSSLLFKPLAVLLATLICIALQGYSSCPEEQALTLHYLHCGGLVLWGGVTG